MRTIFPAWVVCASMLVLLASSETPKERVLRQQLEAMQISLDRANAAVARLQKDAQSRTKEVKSSMAGVSEQATENENSRVLTSEFAQQTAALARVAALEVAASNRALVVDLLVGQLVAFVIMLAALAFVLIDVRTKASRDRGVYLESVSKHQQDVLEIMTGTKTAMVELASHTNHKMDLLLEAKDALRTSTNAAEFSKGVKEGAAGR